MDLDLEWFVPFASGGLLSYVNRWFHCWYQGPEGFKLEKDDLNAVIGRSQSVCCSHEMPHTTTSTVKVSSLDRGLWLWLWFAVLLGILWSLCLGFLATIFSYRSFGSNRGNVGNLPAIDHVAAEVDKAADAQRHKSFSIHRRQPAVGQ